MGYSWCVEPAQLCSGTGNLDIVCHWLFPKLLMYLRKFEGVLIFGELHPLSTEVAMEEEQGCERR